MMNIHRITYNKKANSCSIYFIGCNFHCLGCYWKELYGKFRLRQLRLLNLEETLETLCKVRPKRVYILTGEPRATIEFTELPEALHNEFGCEVRLQTNGYIIPNIKGLNHVSMSIKAYSDKIHRWYTGKSNSVPLRNFRHLHKAGVELSSSTVLIPDYIDLDEVEKIAKFISAIDRNIPYRVIGYSSVKGQHFREPLYHEVQKAAEVAMRYLTNVTFSRPSGQGYSGIVDLFSNNLGKAK